MAAQALVSSSSLTSSIETARQIFGSRNYGVSSFTSLRKNSLVVRASATPPVKVFPIFDF